ncbi:MAG TPA: ATP-dependent DNA helicase RecG [Thermotogota bacterium]|nr:ATP-dependent DNA helicase RecG [Thermotogota bacterium]
MLLLEEFLHRCENLFEQTASGELAPSGLYPALVNEWKKLDPKTRENSALHQKLRLLVGHYADFQALEASRRQKRLENGPLMLHTLRESFLLPPLEQGTPATPDCTKLKSELKFLKGVGPKREELLERLGIKTPEDLLWNFPRTYEDRRKITYISDLLPGERATVFGEVTTCDSRHTSGGGFLLQVHLQDTSGDIFINWFNQAYLKDVIKVGMHLLVTGTVKANRFTGTEIVPEEFERIDADIPPEGEIVPVYRETTGLKRTRVRAITRNVLPLAHCLADPLPPDLLEKYAFVSLPLAIAGIHFPVSFFHLERCRQRLVYDEFFFFELSALFSRKKRDAATPKSGKAFSGELATRLENSLPFSLTGAQKRVVSQLNQQLASPYRMNLLLQGDVGSGKTIVAEMAMLSAVEAGYQVALMAPTSILAKQHFDAIRSHFDPLGVEVGLLVSGLPTKDRESRKQKISSGECPVVVGTHALIQQGVDFSRLGLAIIDEQHRFGVRQRETLVQKGQDVDMLVMTATPIPRTLALSVYGDLDVAVLDEMPPGRQAVRTVMLGEKKRKELYDFIRKECNAQNQAFLVYPVIDESENNELKAATTMYEQLKKEVFPSLQVGLLHGRLGTEEKDEVMQRFAGGEFQVLVCTTVVEVGIDVPNATVMVIEHPERFGLAQLHQLRGRVGRSDRASFCFLLLENPSSQSFERLDFFARTFNGFELAEYDLRTRGPGEFLGIRQHGMPDFKVADIVEHASWLVTARQDALSLLSKDPTLDSCPAVKRFLEEHYTERMKLLEIG